MDLNFDAALAFIEQGKRFLLTTHINSDADGIGANIALKRLLEQLGKEAHIGLPDALPANASSSRDGTACTT